MYQQPFSQGAGLQSSTNSYQQPFAVSGNNTVLQGSQGPFPGTQSQSQFPGMQHNPQSQFPGLQQTPQPQFPGVQSQFPGMQSTQSQFPGMQQQPQFPGQQQPQFPGMQTQPSFLGLSQQAALPGMQPQITTTSQQPAFPGLLSPGGNILTPAAKLYLEQIQQFLIQHNLALEDLLLRDMGIPKEARYISRENLEMLGRHCRVEPLIDAVALSELENRFRETAPGVNFPNNLSIQSLRQSLNSTGVTKESHRELSKRDNTAYEIIQKHMKAHKIQQAYELFGDKTISEGTGENIAMYVEKLNFQEILQRIPGLFPDIINGILADVSNADGRISIKKLEDKLSLQQPLAALPQRMDPAKAKQIVLKSFDFIKQFLTMNEANLVDIFTEQEKDDGYLNRNELSNALEKMGFHNQGEEHENRIEALFIEFDRQKTLKLDIDQIVNAFYAYANETMEKEKARFPGIFNALREKMREKNLLSLASYFFDTAYVARHQLEIGKARTDASPYPYEKERFAEQMRLELQIPQFTGKDKDEFLKYFEHNDTRLNYQRFSDVLGYIKPPKSNKDENRRIFYKLFLKDLQGLSTLEQELTRQDINVQGYLNKAQFKNVLEGLSRSLTNQPNLIELVASDFAFPNQPSMINYRMFIQQVQIELSKAGALHKVFRVFYEYLQFKRNLIDFQASQPDLYGTLFAKVDQGGEKRFSQYGLQDLLEDKLGMQKDLAQAEVQQFFQQYNPKNGFIKFQDIEKDYMAFVAEETRAGKLPKVTTLHEILKLIRNYVEVQGQSLRQVFGKSKVGESDVIHQYQFTKTMNAIVSHASKSGTFHQTELDDVSLSLFINEVSTTSKGKDDLGATMNLSKTMKLDNSKQVSFTELQLLYNSTFNFADSESDSLVPMQVDQLIAYIAKTTLENQRNNFDLKQHLIYPKCSIQEFIDRLMMQPLNCGRDHQHSIFKELGKRYNAGEGVVNTQMLCLDIESKVERQKEKNNVFIELRKQVTLKNTTIQAAITQALPEIQKFKIEYLSPKEFYNVFMYLECKGATELKVREMLSNLLQPDDKGKYSYLEFIKEYKQADEAPAQKRKGRKLYASKEEILKRVAYVIEHRKLRTFGQILADQDLENKQLVAREAFYRTIDSLQFGLGEGDIQELMLSYAKGQFVEIANLRDDLNYLIQSAEYKVQLRSVLDAMINERVVDHIEDGTPRNQSNTQTSDPKLLNQFKLLSREIMTALYVRDTDANAFFPRFATFKKGQLTLGEFKQALEQLDALSVLQDQEKTIQAYYDNMVQRQMHSLGYNESMLLLDQCALLIAQDCTAKTRQKLIEDILMAVAYHLTDKRLPILDIFKTFDSQGNGYIYRSDFQGQFLDNYLKLFMNPRTGEGLSINQKNLLTTRYATSQSMIQFPFELFVIDLKRKQEENSASIRIYLTQKDVQEDDSMDQEAQNKIYEQEQLNSYQQRIMQEELPAQSKKNTHVTVVTANRPHLKGSMQVASFLFDDIMMSTYRRGMSIEEYFRAFSTLKGNELTVGKEDFGRAIASLGIDWGSNMTKVSEIFDAVDIAANKGAPKKVISPTDLAHSVLYNGGHNVDDILSVHIMAVHKALKQRNMLPKLRELFNFINSKRDNTCSQQEFKAMLIDRLELGKSGIIKDHHAEMLIQRYKLEHTDDDVQHPRVNFSGFIRDMEFAEQGISPALIWAVELATNIIKSLIVFGYNSPEQLFQKYIRMQGIMVFDEFKKAIEELHLAEYHIDEELKEFFTHVQLSQTGGAQPALTGIGQQTAFVKVSTVQLVNTIKKLCPKTPGMIYQDIFQALWADTKRNNLSINSVKSAFIEFDLDKHGHVVFDYYARALEERLKVHSIKMLDIKVLSKRYKKLSGQDEVIEYPRFIADYEKFEQLGMRAGHDPLKPQQRSTMHQTGAQAMSQVAKPLNQPQQKLYQDMSAFFKAKNLVDKLCEALASRDGLRGQLSFQKIFEAFESVGAKPNTQQKTLIVEPLPVDPLDSSYNYIIMIELLFGRLKAQETQMKYKLGGLGGTTSARGGAPQKQLVMSQRFKDSIEVKLGHLQGVIHSLSKGSYILREAEFTKVFRSAGIVVASADHELLTQAYTELRSQQTQAIDFRQFIRRFGITDSTAQILQTIQKQLADNKITFDDEATVNYLPVGKETLTLEDFQRFITQAKLDLNAFTMNQVSTAFEQIAERREKIDRNTLIRILKGERENTMQQQDWMPFIANELVYHIVNNSINIYKFVTPGSKQLTLEKFNTLLTQMLKYKPSNPKDMPILFGYFGVKEKEGAAVVNISIDKLVEAVRRVDPTYALDALQKAPASLPQKGAPQKVPTLQTKKESPQEQAQKKLSTFTPKVKELFAKVNEQLRKNGLSTRQLFDQLDKNKNSIVEQTEFLNFFSSDFQVKGVPLPQGLEIMFEALDMNKDGFISINEFCLCLEGVQLSLEQRLKAFDPVLEDSLLKEINTLFDFFDTNKDGQITFTELSSALRASSPHLTAQDVMAMLKAADGDKSETIDRQEFQRLILPQMKMEALGFEKNFEDLRRLFKEFDSDQSGYLSKEEFRAALIKLGIELDERQLEELVSEIDIDQNQVIDIDEFIAFLSIADQIKFQHPATKTTVMKIKTSRKLQPIDFYNCFKNLPKFFLPSFTQPVLEKKCQHAPSHGLYPEFDPRTLQYKDLAKLSDLQQPRAFIERNPPGLACEFSIEECVNIPLPKQEDFDWGKILNRELRIVLADIKSETFLSNVHIMSAGWKPEQPSKWLFNMTECQTNAGRQIMLRTDAGKGNQQYRDIQVLFELVLYTKQGQDTQPQQVCCAWGSLPLSQLDKAAKHKIALKGGSPFSELKMSKEELFQEKRGFEFLKKLTAQTEDAALLLSLKPFSKFTELQQLQVSMLPSSCIFNRRLLSFLAAFRVYSQRHLNKAQQQMIAPQGSFALAQFRKVYDSPDVQLVLAECWEAWEQDSKQAPTIEQLIVKMEEYLLKAYAIVYSEEFRYDHVYPTRSLPVDSELFFQRELAIKQQLAPIKYKKLSLDSATAKKSAANKENDALLAQMISVNEYKPFNIAEMEVEMGGAAMASALVEAKQDELSKLYQQLGLLY